MKPRVAIISFLILAGGLSGIAFWPRTEKIMPAAEPLVSGLPEAGSTDTSSTVVKVPEIKIATPEEVRGLYLTGWIAGIPSRRAQIISLMERLKMNTVVIDVKDYSGYVSYHMPNVPAVAAAGADRQVRITDPESVIKDFHDKGIYVIARVTVFQDPIFAAAHPELSLKDARTGKTWRDGKGLSWLDPAAEPVWEYVESIGKDASERGFDEINFDYIRFPSDGALKSVTFPFYKEIEPKHEVIARFFSHLRTKMDKEVISADLFGLTTSATDDMGIGQLLEDAFPNFDYILPMIYPSHFAAGSYGYKDPSSMPLEMVERSMSDAVTRRNVFVEKNPNLNVAKLRPWLQAFDLGARYDNKKIEAQITGVKNNFASSSGAINGWVFWDPKNTYADL